MIAVIVMLVVLYLLKRLIEDFDFKKVVRKKRTKRRREPIPPFKPFVEGLAKEYGAFPATRALSILLEEYSRAYKIETFLGDFWKLHYSSSYIYGSMGERFFQEGIELSVEGRKRVFYSLIKKGADVLEDKIDFYVNTEIRNSFYFDFSSDKDTQVAEAKLRSYIIYTIKEEIGEDLLSLLKEELKEDRVGEAFEEVLSAYDELVSASTPFDDEKGGNEVRESRVFWAIEDLEIVQRLSAHQDSLNQEEKETLVRLLKEIARSFRATAEPLRELSSKTHQSKRELLMTSLKAKEEALRELNNQLERGLKE